ncbi:hypothetical protein ACOXVJ_13625 [Pseudomonas knackmussii]|uniref:hypothetical protein n=1 Tax=Pseudomonas knackmussii TaxID=65741 RepID=UPI003BC6F469
MTGQQQAGHEKKRVLYQKMGAGLSLQDEGRFPMDLPKIAQNKKGDPCGSPFSVLPKQRIW